MDLKHHGISIKTNGVYALNPLVQALGAPYQPGVANIPPMTLVLPATLKIGTQVYIAMTFKLAYTQAKGVGKGVTAK